MSGNDDFLEWPIKIKNIHIQGLKITKESFIRHHLASLTQPLTQPDSYGELDKRIGEVKKKLHGLDIFTNIKLILDKTPTGQLDHDIIAVVEEKDCRAASINANTSPETGQQSIGITGLSRNALGAAENLKVSMTFGALTTPSGSLDFSKPYPFGNFATLNLRSFYTVNDNRYSSSYFEHSRGGKITLSDLSGHHRIGYTYDWRDVSPSGYANNLHDKLVSSKNKKIKKPSESVKTCVRSSIKSSIDYNFSISQLDSPLLPTQGRAINFSTELAGLGGDVQFGKVKADAKFYYPIHRHVSLGTSFRCGYLRPLSNFLSQKNDTNERQSLINDRFFLGGPLVMRGFGANSIGPSDSGDYLGGDLYASAGIEGTFSLPFQSCQQNGIRGHIFANCGNLISMHDSEIDRKRKLPIKNFSSSSNDNNHSGGTDKNITDLLSGMRASIGTGLVIPTPLGRLEFNFSYPLRTFPGDIVKSWQFGFGVIVS